MRATSFAELRTTESTPRPPSAISNCESTKYTIKIEYLASLFLEVVMTTKKDSLFDDRGDWLVEWIGTIDLDKHLLLNCVSYFLASIVFGAPFWKSVVICVVVGLATFLHYGRSLLTRLGAFAMIASMVEWSEILPPTRQMVSKLFGLW